MDEKSIYFKPHAPGEIDVNTGEEMGPMAVLAEHINEAGKIKIVGAVPGDDEGDIGDVVIVL
ncbi:MAG: hypothetical protein VW551_05780 [Euryarchaeota archaeon]|jgi:hypothetical protein